MKKLFALGAMLALATSAFAAPNVTNVTQKGSLLIWPDIRIDDSWNTLIRIQNDGSQDVDVVCYWMDGNKNRVDFVFTITKNQPVWFDARTGNGTYQVNRFPQSPSNGIDNPFLVTTGATAEVVPFATVVGTTGDDAPAFWRGPYQKGLLACWAADGGAQNQVKWNHLSGTATVYYAGVLGYEYHAYAFFVPTGLDQEPVGSAGTLNLNGVEYDSCPLYQIGQFTPASQLPGGPVLPPTIEPLALPLPAGAFPLGVRLNRLAVVGCNLDLRQDFVPTFTKLQFDVWNEEEIKFTGAFECADSWHETTFLDPTDSALIFLATFGAGGGIDSASQNFTFQTLGTFAARYRVQGVKSTQCEQAAATGRGAVVTSNVGLIGVQSTYMGGFIGDTLTSAGKFTGKVQWDPEGVVPEGGIR